MSQIGICTYAKTFVFRVGRVWHRVIKSTDFRIRATKRPVKDGPERVTHERRPARLDWQRGAHVTTTFKRIPPQYVPRTYHAQRREIKRLLLEQNEAARVKSRAA